MEIKIRDAGVDDARLIGKVVTMAIGEELARELAGEDHTVADVERMFATLAAREDSQYSYRNSLVATDTADNIMGIVVAYDGARLHTLRKAFMEEAKNAIGLTFDREPDDETDSEEYYLDSLGVFPLYRGLGVARSLIEAAAEKAMESGKPLGLLCSKGNHRARKLYDSLGFRSVGERPFAGEVMDHLTKSSQ